MSKRFFAISSAVLLILAIGIWFFLSSEHNIFVDSKERSEKNDVKTSRGKSGTPPTPVRVAAHNGQRVISVDDEGVTKLDGMSDRDWIRLLRIHATKKTANRKIEFYGKIVDQDGNPIEGVVVEGAVTSWESSLSNYLSTGQDRVEEPISLMSDQNGQFMCEEHFGTSFTIKKMLKTGYVREKKARYHFMWSNFASGVESPEFHRPVKHDPVIYTMWKKGETERLILLSSRLHFSKDTGVKTLYLPFLTKAKPSTSPVSGWDVKVTGLNRGPGNWHFSLTASGDGGIILSNDAHTNRAPKEGYEHSIEFNASDLDSERQNLSNVYVYYKGPGGAKYATFRLSYHRYGGRNGGDFMVELAGIRVNPNASRNLEYDKSKRINR